MNVHDVGDRVVIVGKFEDRTGVAVDPDVIALKIKNPDGTVDTYWYSYSGDILITRIEAGHYELEFDITQYGIYYYYWYSTGVGKTAGENSFEVRKSKVLEVL